MNHTEIIESQIALLVNLNQQLASQATPEAARELRENAKLIAELAVKARDVAHVVQNTVEDLEERLNMVEEVLFGEWEPDMEILKTNYGRTSLMFFARDCREDLNTVYNWMNAIEKHLELDDDWMEEYEEEAGD